MSKGTERNNYLYSKPPYLYFRFPARFREKPIPLPPDRTSRAFERAYDKCVEMLGELETVEVGFEFAEQRAARAKTERGTIGRAIEIYLGSAAFRDRKESTQRVYRSICDTMKADMGDGPLCELDRDALEDYHDAKFEEGGKAAMADLYVTLVNNIWCQVRKSEEFGIRKLANPTIEIERKHKDHQKNPHLRWSEEAQDRFMEAAPPNLQLARDLLRFSAQRGGDCVRMQWKHYDGRGINVWPQKTTAKGAVLDPEYHLLPQPLIRELNAAKKTARSEFILVNRWGNPWANSNGLSQAIRRLITKIGIRKKGKKSVSMHGLRHTAGSEVAELEGVGIKGIMGVTGHKTEKQAAHYARQADKRRINERTIAAWNAELERKDRDREARARAGRRAALRVVK
jgi:integrase